MHKLRPEEEIALRRIANESISPELKLARRLVELNLAEPFKDTWRLTPLGRRQYELLARPPLFVKRHPTYVDRLLDRAIPLARAAGITQPDPIAESAEGHTIGPTAGPVGQDAETGPLEPTAAQTEYEELRSKCSTALSEFCRTSHQTKIENDRAVANSREAIKRSWLLLTKSARMVR